MIKYRTDVRENGRRQNLMLIQENLSIEEKLRILSDAAEV